ncbi:zinc-binding metallopeptidase family protein [Costertonia aggregata]|uniref:Uncharacterized protein n=1 Tax=Costertonia aggregata TaxID=343403 RepID=A0A7H9AS86_9FLAO|nr:hypothetical protein [Costertonia aggregata]QLG46310.1 hypothetical protein HYG79_13455 [Costertonia aggregata]
MLKSFLFFALFTSFIHIGNSQSLSASKIKILAKEKLPEALENFNDFLKIPNDGHYPIQVKNNLKWCDSVFSKLKFDTKILKTKGAPLLFAEKKISAKKKTVLFYLQIDGQPVDTSKWNQANPFVPVLKANKNSTWEIIDFDRLQTEFDPDW